MTYARFTVDTNTFETTGLQFGEGLSAFEHFLSFWRDYGIFVALDTIPLRDRLPEDLLKKYNEIYKSMHHSANRLDSSPVKFDAVLSDLVSGSFDSLNKLNLEVIGLLEAIYEEITPTARGLTYRVREREEICRVRDLLLSETRKRLDLLRDSDVPKHQPAEQVWREKLRPIFQTNNLISVVDPYALVDLHKARDPVNSGLGFLLKKIGSEHPRIGHVEILTSFRGITKTEKSTADAVRADAIEKLRRFCANSNVREVNIYIAGQQVAEQLMHDRFIIGAEHTIDVGRGLYLLSLAPRHQASSFSFKRLTDERSRTYHMLRNARRGMQFLRF